MVLCVAAGLALGAGNAAAQQLVRTESTGPLEIHVGVADVRVVGWGRGEVEVTGEEGRARPTISEERGRTMVRIPGGRGASLVVRVPSRRDVTVHAGYGDVRVAEVGGSVTVHAANGSVEVDGRPRRVQVNTRTGDVEMSVNTEAVSVHSENGDVQIDGAVRRGVEVNTVGGAVTVSAEVPDARVRTMNGDVTLRGIGGRAEVESVSGDVVVQGRRLRASIGTVSGDVRLEGGLEPGRTTQIRTHGGEVTLALDRRTGADVQFTTQTGELDSDLADARVTRTSRRERQVRIGRGGARVVILTFSGDVRLEN